LAAEENELISSGSRSRIEADHDTVMQILGIKARLAATYCSDRPADWCL